MYEQHGKTIVKTLLIILIACGIAAYSLYQAKNIIRGPQITIDSPQNGSSVDTPEVIIKGNAKNISYISLNDRQIFVDKDGAFTEELLLASGYNKWKVEAKDKFGGIVSKRIEIVLRNN